MFVHTHQSNKVCKKKMQNKPRFNGFILLFHPFLQSKEFFNNTLEVWKLKHFKVSQNVFLTLLVSY